MFRFNVSRPYAAALTAVFACASAQPAAASSFTMIHAFSGTDGLLPQGHLFYDYLNSSAVVIGSTEAGGADSAGTVFTYTLKNPVFSTFYSFTGPPASETPVGGVTIDISKTSSIVGEIVGTTANGGANSDGTIYTISTGGAYTNQYSFGGVANSANPGAPLDGLSPVGAMAEGGDGNFYGTTSNGGAGASGTIFQYNPISNAVSTIYTFGNNPAVLDGETPLEGLTLSSKSSTKFYGTTSSGGMYGNGAIYSVTTSGVVTTLYSFTGGTDGANPQCLIAQDSKGNLYGTTPAAGADGYGTLWELTTGNVFSVLHAFTGGTDGATPMAGVVFGDKDRLYGTASAGGKHGVGDIFEYNIEGNTFATEHSFLNSADGGNPESQLLPGPNGVLFGTAMSGGTNGFGSFFEFTPST